MTMTEERAQHLIRLGVMTEEECQEAWGRKLREPAIPAAPPPPPRRGNPPNRLAARNNAKTRIVMERERQIELWGDGPQPMDIRLAVLTEELGEVARAMQDEGDARLIEELVQVSAAALRWVEDLLLEMDR